MPQPSARLRCNISVMPSSLAVSFSGYKRSWLTADVLAGLTLIAIAVPEQIATAKLANMPAVTGLWAFVVGSLMIAVLGRSAHVSVGADSTIAPVLAAGVASVAASGARATELTSFVAIAVGVVVIAAGLLKFGWIADFLSAPVIAGVLAGIGVEIVVRELPVVLGVPAGGTTTVDRLRHVVDNIGSANGWTIVLAALVLVSIFGAERIDARIPGALIGVVASTAVVATVGASRLGVAVLGPIHSGWPTVGLPGATIDEARALVPTALTVAFLCFAQTSATIRASADVAEDNELNGDLVAIGAGSTTAGLLGSFAVNASPARTAAVISAGGRTQASSLVGGVIVGCIALFAGGSVMNVPEAALGAILLFVATRLMHIDELRGIARFSTVEFGLAAVTLATVALIGIEQGLVIAIVLSLLDRTRRAARPNDVLLGREPGTDHWIPVDIGRPTEQVPGVLVYLVYSAIWYGNAEYLRRRIRDIVAGAPDPVRVFVLDANGISDIDYTAAKALGVLLSELDRSGVKTGIARTSHLVHHDLKHSGLLAQLGSDRMFTTVSDAVVVLSA
jgi:MFS superfamily sulfate permease-like transporter